MPAESAASKYDLNSCVRLASCPVFISERIVNIRKTYLQFYPFYYTASEMLHSPI
jgi:hypothetical protein